MSLLESGQRIGNYVLQEKIGAGAFAEVWKSVHHERPGRVVALKVAVDPAYRKQLAREGRLPEINHPNVVPILDSDTRFADPPYVVMPYCSGGNLARLIAAHPAGLPEERVEQLLRDILAGLAAAHEKGVVHRDVKPSNILLDENGLALIADFGLSFLSVSETTGSILQTVSIQEGRGTLAGTLAYMAPEVIQGTESNAASDVYAVGMILFQMLTGRLPEGVDQRPGRVRNDLNDGSRWDRLFEGMCASRGARYRDAREMIHAMNNDESIRSGQTPAGTSRNRPEEHGEATVRLVVFPPESVRLFLDYEDIGATGLEFKVRTPERHELLILPRNFRWGTQRVAFHARPGETLRLVIQLRQVLHARTLLGGLATVAYGAIVAALLSFLPFPPWKDLPDGRGVVLYALFGGIPTVLLWFIPVWQLARHVRGFESLSQPIDPSEWCAPIGWAFAVSLVLFYAALLSAYKLSPAFTFSIWSLVTSCLLALLLFIVPWKVRYYAVRW